MLKYTPEEQTESRMQLCRSVGFDGNLHRYKEGGIRLRRFQSVPDTADRDRSVVKGNWTWKFQSVPFNERGTYVPNQGGTA